jgi:hypothetical protein
MNGEIYAYFTLPWIKLSMGSNVAEFYQFESTIPDELKKLLDDEKR